MRVKGEGEGRGRSSGGEGVLASSTPSYGFRAAPAPLNALRMPTTSLGQSPTLREAVMLPCALAREWIEREEDCVERREREELGEERRGGGWVGGRERIGDLRGIDSKVAASRRLKRSSRESVRRRGGQLAELFVDVSEVHLARLTILLRRG